MSSFSSSAFGILAFDVLSFDLSEVSTLAAGSLITGAITIATPEIKPDPNVNGKVILRVGAVRKITRVK